MKQRTVRLETEELFWPEKNFLGWEAVIEVDMVFREADRESGLSESWEVSNHRISEYVMIEASNGEELHRPDTREMLDRFPATKIAVDRAAFQFVDDNAVRLGEMAAMEDEAAADEAADLKMRAARE